MQQRQPTPRIKPASPAQPWPPPPPLSMYICMHHCTHVAPRPPPASQPFPTPGRHPLKPGNMRAARHSRVARPPPPASPAGRAPRSCRSQSAARSRRTASLRRTCRSARAGWDGETTCGGGEALLGSKVDAHECTQQTAIPGKHQQLPNMAITVTHLSSGLIRQRDRRTHANATIGGGHVVRLSCVVNQDACTKERRAGHTWVSFGREWSVAAPHTQAAGRPSIAWQVAGAIKVQSSPTQCSPHQRRGRPGRASSGSRTPRPGRTCASKK